MASRYSVATGNWNSTSTWAATSGGAAGASFPVAGDDVFIDANFIVNITGADAACATLTHTNGQLKFTNSLLHVPRKLQMSGSAGGQRKFESSGATARTITMQGGFIEFIDGGSNIFRFSGSNLTYSSSGTITFLSNSATASTVETSGKNLGYFTIYLGDGSNVSTATNISGGGGFLTLLIKSLNTAAHTVNFDNNTYNVNYNFVAIGSSSGSKLEIKPSGAYTPLLNNTVGQPGTYGQYVNMNGVNHTGTGARYIGSTSVDSGGTWLIQDPPKASTLVDNLLVAPGSNTNIAVYFGSLSTVSTGSGGGGYTAASQGNFYTTGSFDLVDSQIVFEAPSLPLSVSGTSSISLSMNDDSNLVNAGKISVSATTSSGSMSTELRLHNDPGLYTAGGISIPQAGRVYVRYSYTSVTNKFEVAYSLDNRTWTTTISITPNADALLLLRCCYFVGIVAKYTLGSINPLAGFLLDGDSTLTGDGIITRFGDASLSTDSALNATGWLETFAAATINGDSVISASGGRDTFGAVSMLGDSILDAIGSSAITGSAMLAGDSSLVADGFYMTPRGPVSYVNVQSGIVTPRMGGATQANQRSSAPAIMQRGRARAMPRLPRPRPSSPPTIRPPRPF